MPRVCWNLMTWVDPERIYTTKAIFGFKRNPKESAWATNIRCTLLSQLSLGIFHELPVKRVFFSNVQASITQACAGSIPESQLKRKISHSVIHMGFIGLVIWSKVRRLWKKGLESTKIVWGLYWVRTSRALLVSFELGSTPFVSYINLSLHFCVFLVEFGDLLSPPFFFLFFFHSSLANFILFSIIA